MNSIELRQAKHKLTAEAEALFNKVETENRELTQDESDTWDKLMGDVAALEKDISKAEKRERLEVLKEEANTPLPRKVSSYAYISEREEPDQEKALRTWLLAGSPKSTLTREAVRNAERCGFDVYSNTINLNLHTRALSHTNSAGGYTVPVHPPGLAEHLKYFCPIRNIVQVITTSDGNAMSWATNDDSSNLGERITENTAHNEQDLTFGTVSLSAYPYSSKMVRIPLMLVEDSSINIEDYVSKKLAERIGRIQEYEFVFSGTGSGQPKSLVAASSAGKTSFDVTDWEHFADLIHSVDLAYRQSAAFLVNDLTKLAMAKHKDGEDRPLWLDGNLQNGEPNRYMGFPVYVSNSLDYTGSNKKIVLFGDYSGFIIRDVGSVEISRSTDRYFEYRQVAIVGWQRSDSNFIGPSSSLKHGVTA